VKLSRALDRDVSHTSALAGDRTVFRPRSRTPRWTERVPQSDDGRRSFMRARCSAASRVPFGASAALLDTACAPRRLALSDGPHGAVPILLLDTDPQVGVIYKGWILTYHTRSETGVSGASHV
jgi:hypothetical protein